MDPLHQGEEVSLVSQRSGLKMHVRIVSLMHLYAQIVSLTYIQLSNFSLGKSMISIDYCGVAATSAEDVHSKIVIHMLPVATCTTDTLESHPPSWNAMDLDGCPNKKGMLS